MKKSSRSFSVYLVSGLLMSLVLTAVLASGEDKPAAQSATPRYKDASLPIQDRVADLLPRMTLEEKVDQLNWGWQYKVDVADPTGTFTAETARKTLAAEWGPEIKFTPRNAAILRNAVQRYQLEKTRLGIPVMFPGEALHGYMEYGSTSFPQALGLASTWDPALVKRIFVAIGDEAGSRGNDQVFSPVLDIARDPRWGRTEETYGEDPYLVSRMGVAAIEGLQGDSYRIGQHHVLATAKHFAVHGQPEGGTNTAPGNISERVVRENFLVPFQAAVQEAHVGSVMASYNEIDGVPSHVNHWLLDTVLRGEWGFDGYVSSDDDGLQMLVSNASRGLQLGRRSATGTGRRNRFRCVGRPGVHTLADQVKKGTVPIAMWIGRLRGCWQQSFDWGCSTILMSIPTTRRR